MPRVQMTPMVKFALYGLRIYLVVLLALIIVGFIRKVSKSQTPPQEQPPAAASPQH